MYLPYVYVYGGVALVGGSVEGGGAVTPEIEKGELRYIYIYIYIYVCIHVCIIMCVCIYTSDSRLNSIYIFYTYIYI